VKLYRITLFVCLAAPIAFSFVFPPPGDAGERNQGDSVIYHVPCCLFRSVTTIPCPFCGLTRSFVSVARGRFRDAWLYHPLGPPLFLAFILGALAQLVPRRKPDPESPKPKSKADRWGFWSGVLLVCLFAAAWATKMFFIPRAYW